MTAGVSLLEQEFGCCLGIRDAVSLSLLHVTAAVPQQS